MKLIYNIINYRAQSGGLLELKIRLTKADWILINQFKAKPLSVICSVTESDFIADTSENISIEKPQFGTTDLTFNIGLNFNEIKQEETDSYWESPVFKVDLNVLQSPLSNMLEYISQQLTEQMFEKKSSVPQNDGSCWEEELTIEF
ncbi:hypothetical protein [uncultured Desulfuromusa sp.]|uniref:hypothetical protein n=1 Tax=uncultured Desulfuromusa sp. TaxID=219183 RepID=UPI002AA83D3D|nr:hypothetical protein [uncultured Desulfuromusa sp.]